MNVSSLKIAGAARTIGVSPSTLRLWEQHGLIEPIRTPSGQRLYDEALISRLRVILRLRNVKGFNPAAIKRALSQGKSKDNQHLTTTEQQAESTDLPIGMKLRHLRRKAGLTLAAVAQETGAAISVLSTFERNSQGISITTLNNVAHFLGTTIATLSGQTNPRHRASLVRKGKWRAWPRTTAGVTIQVLADGINQMECHRFDLAPGTSSEGAYQHEGEEFIHVLTGRLEIILDDDQFFALSAGDSFYFESMQQHAWRNVHDGQTTLIWINTPPSF